MKGGPSMNKQTGAWHSPQTRRQPVYLPADVLDDDALYTRRTPSSVRRYATTFPTSVQPRTEIRFIRHQGPPPMQRASRLSAAEPQTRPARRKAHWRLHWLNSVGLGMLATLMLAGILSPLWHWWQGEQDSLQYGYPRTFQCDQDVRHGGMSHFLAENLHGCGYPDLRITVNRQRYLFINDQTAFCPATPADKISGIGG